MGAPIVNDLLHVIAHREKPYRKGLAGFSAHLARILKDTVFQLV
jgi:hypothetical protein